jgi:DNA-binding MarR family transcriptional regulator
MSGVWLDEVEAAAWRGYRRMSVHLEAELARDLVAGSEMSMSDYSVLSTLGRVRENQPDEPGMRVASLASHLEWEQSRLSHHLRRMQDRGLVTRCADAGDRRCQRVSLTDAGWDAIVAAAPGHVTDVRRRFVDVLTREQLEQLALITDAVLGQLDLGSLQ